MVARRSARTAIFPTCGCWSRPTATTIAIARHPSPRPSAEQMAPARRRSRARSVSCSHRCASFDHNDDAEQPSTPDSISRKRRAKLRAVPSSSSCVRANAPRLHDSNPRKRPCYWVHLHPPRMSRGGTCRHRDNASSAYSPPFSSPLPSVDLAQHFWNARGRPWSAPPSRA